MNDKKSKQIPEYKKLGFDSGEEEYLAWYLVALYEAGYIKSFIHHPESYVLSASQKYTCFKTLHGKISKGTLSILRPHSYTSDFYVEWNEKAEGIFFNSLSSQIDLRNVPFIANEKNIVLGYGNRTSVPYTYSVIEVKPEFSQYNSQREFSINQKWMYQKYGIFVQKVIVFDKNKISGLFPETFTPNKFLYTHKRKQLKRLNYKPITIQTYVERREIEYKLETEELNKFREKE